MFKEHFVTLDMGNLIDFKVLNDRGEEQHVEVSEPAGSGGGYYLYVNQYFQGQIVHTSDGWKGYVKLDVLSVDDLDVIMDAIKEGRTLHSLKR